MEIGGEIGISRDDYQYCGSIFLISYIGNYLGSCSSKSIVLSRNLNSEALSQKNRLCFQAPIAKPTLPWGYWYFRGSGGVKIGITTGLYMGIV